MGGSGGGGGGSGEILLICGVLQFPCYKHSHHGQFQAIDMSTSLQNSWKLKIGSHELVQASSNTPLPQPNKEWTKARKGQLTENRNGSYMYEIVFSLTHKLK